MTPDALPVTRRGGTRWESPVPVYPTLAPVLTVLAAFDADEHRDRCARAERQAIMVEIGDLARKVDRLLTLVDARAVTS